MRKRMAASICFATFVGFVASALPTQAASPPAPPQLVAPMHGSIVKPGTDLAVVVTDTDNSPLEVRFHAATRGSTGPGSAGVPFVFATIPDTQGYVITPTYHGVLNKQLEWIVANRSSLNIAFTTGLGDIVDNHISTPQWTRATTSMAILDNGDVPYAVLPGNHDFDVDTGVFAGYDTYFPVSRYRDARWNSATARYGGYYGQNEFGPDVADRQNMNSYSLFTAGGMEFILIALELNAPDGVLEWAKRVLDAYPNRRAIISTHSYLFTTGNLSNELRRADVPGNTGAQIFQKLVYSSCNVFLVVNGHFHDEANRVDQNACGKPVYSALTDYQSRGNGGDGWLRYYQFDPAQDTITAVTYSPYRDEYETDADSAFTMPYEMDTTLELPVIAERTAASGTTVSVPVPDVADGTILDWYVTVSDGTATTRSQTWSSTVSSASATPPLALDSFTRSVGSGWGAADVGGAWTVNSTSKLSVPGGVGRVSANAGSSLTATLGAVTATSVSAQVEVVLDRLPNNQWLGATISPRQIGGSGYGMRTRVLPSGVIVLELLRDSTLLATQALPGVTAVANTPLHLHVQAEGVNPTQLRGRVWPNGVPEPTTWQVTASDNAANLQQPGGIQLTTYLHSSAANGPVIVTYDNLIATGIGDTPAPNAPPLAVFSPTVSDLSVSVDGSASSDPDGTIASYAWNWGDNATSTTPGALASHTYSTAGTYTITLTVTDGRGASSSTSRQVEVGHSAPVATFVASTSGLTANVDASGSAASGGATLVYSWDWGDESPASSGSQASHAYANAGTYLITLTATDSLGATATTMRTVAVQSTTLAVLDEFERVVSAGWGNAPAGGAWTVTLGSATVASVNGTKGVLNLAPGATRRMALLSVPLTNSESVLDYRMGFAPASGSGYVGVTFRQSATDGYNVQVWHRNNGTLWLVAERSGMLIATQPISGLAWASGSEFTLKAEVTGSNPTTLRGKIWQRGAVEPPAWQLQATDATASLQGSGYETIRYALSSSSATSGVVEFDRISIRDLDEPAGNLPPVAAFLSTVSGLSVSVNGSGSSDPDGTVSSYSWDWGDGTAHSTGATASHAYVAAGEYEVKLTVVDNRDASHSTTKTIAVTVPVENLPPVAAFLSTVSGLSVSANGSGSSDPDGTIASYAWEWGDGTAHSTGVTASHVYAAAGDYEVTLTVVDDQDASHSVTKTVTVAAPVENLPPVAAFLSTVSGLSVSANGSGSSDPDGTIASYAWEWGDGTAHSTGVTVAHTYSAAGTYTINLTVTDDDGATHTVSDVVVAEAPVTPGFLIRDDFDRTATASWGTASIGGAWTISGGSAAAASVAAGEARLSLSAGSTRVGLLTQTALREHIAQVDFSTNAGPETGGTYAGFVSRDVGSTSYVVQAWLRPNGTVWLLAQRGSTLLQTYALPGMTYQAGDRFTLKVELTGTVVTQIRAKLWRNGAAEPSAWQLVAMDADPALRAAGVLGLKANRSSSSTGPVLVTFERLTVTRVD